MQQVIAKYSETPEELNYPDDPDTQLGLFDARALPDHRNYTREFRTESVREMAFAWLSCFYADCDDDERSFLTVIRTNMKAKAGTAVKVRDAQQFVEAFAQQEEHRWTLYFLVELSQFYFGTITLDELSQSIRKRQSFEVRQTPKPLHWKVMVVLVDALLEAVVIIRDGYSLLYDEYVEIFKMVSAFAGKALELDPVIPLLLLLRKLQRALAVTNSPDEEIIE
jgi:hypothetical protein